MATTSSLLNEDKENNSSFDREQRDILVLYATETGNALDIAEQVAREAARRLFSVQLASTDAYPLENLVHEAYIIFVVSTTGSGQEPRSMSEIWIMLLRADLPRDLLEDLRFAVFGLGDTAYEKFCWAAKKLERRLESLGAIPICVRGEGDEQDLLGIEGALDAWMPKMFEALEQYLSPPSNANFIDPNALHPPRIVISNALEFDTIPNSVTQPIVDGSHLVTVRRNQRITAEDWFQDVRHIELNLEGDIPYAPGDVAVIHPVAHFVDVESTLVNLGWSNIADKEFLFSPSDKFWNIPERIPRKTTPRELFQRYLDINAVPRRSFFKIVRHFAHDEVEKEKLEEFCTAEGAEELYDYVTQVRRTIHEVLGDFRSIQIPRECIFDIFPIMRPRQFSIASSSRVHTKQVHICVAVVKYKTRLKIPRRGLCSTYLASIKPGDKLRIQIQKGFLRAPRDLSVPVLCVGPGTGIAPLRALLVERAQEETEENTLYFGCRSAQKDHHYASEWKAMEESGLLTYRVAFSRDGPEGVKRTYVQDLMEKDANIIWDIVGKKRGWVYICGSSNKMPTAVKGAIAYAAQTAGELTEEESHKFVQQMQLEGRLYEECWS